MLTKSIITVILFEYTFLEREVKVCVRLTEPGFFLWDQRLRVCHNLKVSAKMKNADRFALWSLLRMPERTVIENDAVLLNGVRIYRPVSALMHLGYLTPGGDLTDYGKEVAGRPLTPTVLAAARKCVREGKPIKNEYVELRMVHEGLLKEGPGGGLEVVENQNKVMIWVDRKYLPILQMMGIVGA